MKLAQVSHGGCAHQSESWTLALAAALSHANVTMLASSREAVVRRLRGGGTVNHQGVQFKGKVVEDR